MKLKKTYIIAEAGINHNGNYKTALKLIDAAKKSGADAVKFQIFIPEDVVTAKGDMAKYAIKNMKIKEKQLKVIKKYSLSFFQHSKLMKYCKSKKIKYLCSAFDLKSLKFLFKNKLDIFKVPSGEITNYPYLQLLASFKKKIILSTGMSNIKEVKNALKILTQNGSKKKDITILHCHTDYPTDAKNVNLLAMNELKRKFQTHVGISDHTLGAEVPIAAVALGAKIVEKHFTLSREFIGPDHKASMTPNELNDLVKSIRKTELSLGRKLKSPSKKEKEILKLVRKSIVAKNNIKKGEIFNEKNLTTKRPGSGISAIYWKKIIGKKSNKNYKQDELIKS